MLSAIRVLSTYSCILSTIWHVTVHNTGRCTFSNVGFPIAQYVDSWFENKDLLKYYEDTIPLDDTLLQNCVGKRNSVCFATLSVIFHIWQTESSDRQSQTRLELRLYMPVGMVKYCNIVQQYASEVQSETEHECDSSHVGQSFGFVMP